ncbi:MAG: glucosidase, partial [Clostridia bacterium]|nr:glucosidase [Deltaproteobacteria bacterium]
MKTVEDRRLAEDAQRSSYWKRFGPYLAERQWGTVREDYSADQNGWSYFPHTQAQSRAYRWGEDGLLGLADRQARLCFATALWNGNDPCLKERLFGLTGPEGNHGEDVKELYYYLDATPTASYLKALYKYPQERFPYEKLLQEANDRKRDMKLPEYELVDTGCFTRGYFDMLVEYAKADAEDIIVRFRFTNRGDKRAPLHALPTLWFRNTWSWGRNGEGYPSVKPSLERRDECSIIARHVELGDYVLQIDSATDSLAPELIFTENDTNNAKLFSSANATPYVKDAFHRYVVGGERDAVNPAGRGTKAAWHWQTELAAGETKQLQLRLTRLDVSKKKRFPKKSVFDDAETVITARKSDADEFYEARASAKMNDDEKEVVRQAYAGLIWCKQFYQYVVKDWLEGDPSQPTPPAGHQSGRNVDWRHAFMRDVLSMPDSWEYPWFAAWDLAFHMIPFAKIDPTFAKEQLVLMMREWFMHPSGQLPAYEFNFSDVNPPVHAWACWRVYKMAAPRGERDRAFLARTFQKLL